MRIEGVGAAWRGFPVCQLRLSPTPATVKLTVGYAQERSGRSLSHPEAARVAHRLLNPDEQALTADHAVPRVDGVFCGRFVSKSANRRCDGYVFLSLENTRNGYIVIFLTPLQATEVAFYLRNWLTKEAISHKAHEGVV